jgi:hypothetical protein
LRNIDTRISTAVAILRALERAVDASDGLSRVSQETVELSEMNTRLCRQLCDCLPGVQTLAGELRGNARVDMIARVLNALNDKLIETIGVNVNEPWSPSAITLPSSPGIYASTYDVSFMLPQIASRVTSYPKSSVIKPEAPFKPKVTFIEYLEAQQVTGEVEETTTDSSTANMFEIESESGVMSAVAMDEYEVAVSAFEASVIAAELQQGEDRLYIEDDRVSTTVVVETTAVEEIANEDKVVKMILSGIDVLFFLIEALFKSATPLLVDGGALAIKRASQTLGSATIKFPFNQWIAVRSSTAVASNKDTIVSSDWKLFDGLENSKNSL